MSDDSKLVEEKNKWASMAKNLGALSLVLSIGMVIAIIVAGANVNDNDNSTTPAVTNTDEVTSDAAMLTSNVPDNNFYDIQTIFADRGDNNCADKNPKLPNVDCVHVEGPQSGANVTKGYQGDFETDSVPLLTPYWMNDMCPVNVHWHLGTEHYSMGEYDENGDGPNGNIEKPKMDRRLQRDLADVYDKENIRAGFRCHHFDKDDKKFTTPYEWKHCKDMQVGETYEVHWPHSAAGACGKVDQYQTPFYDGVFCTDGVLTDVPGQVGVQAQIYTIVNDEEFFYPDMIRGWIVDGDFADDIAYYTGSTTGTTRSNEICSQYAPITWQVDRKCHMISASSFDKMCYDMKLQRDDMSNDLHAHGSRELVKNSLASNNHARYLMERLIANAAEHTIE